MSKPWMKPLGRTDPPPLGASAEPPGFDKVRFINGAAQDDPIWLFGGLAPRDQAATMKDLTFWRFLAAGPAGHSAREPWSVSQRPERVRFSTW